MLATSIELPEVDCVEETAISAGGLKFKPLDEPSYFQASQRNEPIATILLKAKF
jgi:hypothetical protein